MKRRYEAFDYFCLALVCILSIAGIIFIRSSTLYSDSVVISRLYINQIMWFSVGLLVLAAAAFFDYHLFSKFYVIMYVFNIVLLVIMMVLGKTTSFRWLNIGSMGIQPSEFAKIFTIIFLAAFIDKNQKSINNIFILGFILINVAASFILIKEQPSLSASLVILAVSFSILFAAKVSYKYIIPVVALAGGVVGFVLYDASRAPNFLFIDKIMEEYQINRIISFLNPNTYDPLYYQTLRSIYAVGSGLLTGQGLGGGKLTQIGYVPYAYNDFIISVVGEELGFYGCMALLAIMITLIVRCLIVAYNAVDLLGKLLAVGVAAMFAFQTFVNVGVATGIIINTGMPFPFVSYGGSSMLVSMAGVGLVINVGMTRPKSVFEN